MSSPQSPNLEQLRATLLRSGRSEKPSANARRRTLLAIGIGAAHGLTVTSVAKATGALLAKGFLWKWVGFGVVAGVVSLAGYRAFQASQDSYTSVQAPQASQPGVAPLAPIPSSLAPSSVASTTVSSREELAPIPNGSQRAASVGGLAPQVPPSSSAQRSTSPAEAEQPPKQAGLGEEIAALDEARRAASKGDPNAALRLLGEHNKSFPDSQLAHEAAVLRVEALLAAGRCDAARAEATDFLRANPKSSAAQRMSTLLAQPCPPQASRPDSG